MGDTNKVPVTLHWDSLCVACMKMLLHWTWLVSPFWEASLFPLYKWGKWGTMEQYKDAKTEASTDQLRHLMVGKPSGSHLFFIFSPLLWTWLYLWDRIPDQLWYQGLFASLSLPEAKDSAGRHGVFFFIFMWSWFTNILFFAYAKCSFQSSLGPITPPPKCWLRKSSRVDWWLAWKFILCNKPKKDARSLGRRAKAPQRVGHGHSVLLILHDQRWLSIWQFLCQPWALQLLVINTMNKTFRFIPQEVKAAKIKKKITVQCWLRAPRLQNKPQFGGSR